MALEPVARGVADANVALVQDHVVEIRLVAWLNDRLELEEKVVMSTVVD